MIGPHPPFSWSPSRHQTLETCPRKYYWEYYGYWQGWRNGDSDDPEVKQAYLLKKMTARPLFVGDLAHRGIAYVLRHWAQGKTIPTIEMVRDQMSVILEAAVRQSRDERWRIDPKRMASFFEDYYGDGFTEDDVRAMLQSAVDSVQAFLTDYLPDIQTQAGANCLVIDPGFDDSVEQWEGTQVYLKTDLVWADGPKTIIYDWKTGKPHEHDAEAITWYATLLVDVSGCAAQDIETRLAYLKTGDLLKIEATEEMVDTSRQMARASIDHMQALRDDPNINLVLKAACPMTDSLSTCKWCKFKELCKR